jgi:hypothetical protein
MLLHSNTLAPQARNLFAMWTTDILVRNNTASCRRDA